MAALLRSGLGVEATVCRGWLGEFRVLVNGKTVAKKGWFKFPADQECVRAVALALGKTALL